MNSTLQTDALTDAIDAARTHFGSRSRPKQSAWIMAVPVISTVHITADDRRRLIAGATGDILAEIEGGHGHIIVIEEPDDWTEYSPAMQTLLAAFRELGYKYLRLDSDGEEIADVETFE